MNSKPGGGTPHVARTCQLLEPHRRLGAVADAQTATVDVVSNQETETIGLSGRCGSEMTSATGVESRNACEAVVSSLVVVASSPVPSVAVTSSVVAPSAEVVVAVGESVAQPASVERVSATAERTARLVAGREGEGIRGGFEVSV